MTPIWTGGAEGGVDRIHETGVLGSMRWWYETLVRGLGGRVCNPNQACSFDINRYRKSAANAERQRLFEAGLCDVCQVFGATGWKRRFRLTIEEKQITDAPFQSPIAANRTYTDLRGKTNRPKWYFPAHPPNTPKTGTFNVQVQSLAYGFSTDTVLGLLQFIADWTALGAKAQMGFGVIKPTNGRFDTKPFIEHLHTIKGKEMETHAHMPTLQNIFLSRIRLPNAIDRDTFNLKYDLRRLFAGDKALRHFIMGTVKEGRMAAKVKISRPYDEGIIRVWGWIPEAEYAGYAGHYVKPYDRDRVMGVIWNHLNVNYSISVWREMNSPRDTVLANNSDAVGFLQSLLAGEGGE